MPADERRARRRRRRRAPRPAWSAEVRAGELAPPTRLRRHPTRAAETQDAGDDAGHPECEQGTPQEPHRPMLAHPGRYSRRMAVVVIIVVLVLIVLLLVMSYNGLVRRRTRTQGAWSQIDVALKRGHDLTP